MGLKKIKDKNESMQGELWQRNQECKSIDQIETRVRIKNTEHDNQVKLDLINQAAIYIRELQHRLRQNLEEETASEQVMRQLRLKDERIARDLQNRQEHVRLLKDQVYRLTMMK